MTDPSPQVVVIQNGVRELKLLPDSSSTPVAKSEEPKIAVSTQQGAKVEEPNIAASTRGSGIVGFFNDLFGDQPYVLTKSNGIHDVPYRVTPDDVKEDSGYPDWNDEEKWISVDGHAWRPRPQIDLKN